MNRGANHQKIFLDEADYYYMLELIRLTMEKYPFTLHAYCLMPNHYHFLIETDQCDIAKIMKCIDEYYTRYFNFKYHRDGALFRGRYKSCEINSDDYFVRVSRYISLNPAKALLVSKPEEYKWGSYRSFLGLCEDSITAHSRTLKYFGHDNASMYKKFVESGINCDEYAKMIESDIGESA